MVCVYCGNKTKVINSRLLKRSNSTWRRRQCLECRSVFTSNEELQKHSAIKVAKSDKLIPYDHDKLLISIYESCRHRSSAIEDARALTETIFNRLIAQGTDGLIQIEDIQDAAIITLGNFDKAAMVHYRAYFL